VVIKQMFFASDCETPLEVNGWVSRASSGALKSKHNHLSEDDEEHDREKREHDDCS
jgi:hypothetical protein